MAFFARLGSVGLDRDFVCRRILPLSIAQRLNRKSPMASEAEIHQAASIVGRIFGWDAEEVVGTARLSLATESAGLARFKLPRRADERKVNAYTVYAHYLALLVLQATPDLEPKPVPVDADECRDAVVSDFGSVTFENVLKYAWSLGIPVLPLDDSGTFHGAFWRVVGRNVIVLKQRTASLARWTNDCLHETYHASQEPHLSERSIIEESETSPERRDSEEEQEATKYAADVMLDFRAEELARMCVTAAGGRVDRLKSVVPSVAESEDVSVDALANYMAFRLSLQDVNWWGTAMNLQQANAHPWAIARDWLMPRLDLDRLNATDRQLLHQALTKQEE